MVFLGLIVFLLRYLIRNKRVYSYEYKTIFPLRVLQQNNAFGRKTTYLHSKIYIIDDRIAYLGSLNFTRNGTQNNYETRVRLADSLPVSKIVGEFDELFKSETLPLIELGKWGGYLYRAPLN